MYVLAGDRRKKQWVIVFNAILNNMSVILWWSVLLVEKPEYLEKTTDLSQVTDKILSHNVISSTQRNEGDSNSQRYRW